MNQKLKRTISVGVLLGAAALTLPGLLALSNARAVVQEQPHESAVINYRGAGGGDRVARLQREIEGGRVKLDFSEDGGYLQSVLKELQIPVSSQGLVFSKTSFQLHRISPRNPRAIYFNDDVYVGWVRGGDVLELAAVDPKLGGVFYMIEQRKDAPPRFVRNDDCLQCHAAHSTKGVPGFVVRSVFPDARGYGIAPLGSRVTDHASPFNERWGGWYVTGTHGAARHLGNTLFDETTKLDRLELDAGANVASLDKKVDLTGYASPHSDIVALMVLEHQTQMHNLITKLSYETRLALHYQAAINQALGEPNDKLSESTQRRIRGAADELLKYMLMVGEARLEAPVSGTTDFAKEFAAAGPQDKRGRSLRELDLKRRLFRYPCSFLIYSEAFDALPPPALDYLYRRLWLVLTGQAGEKEFAGLTAEDRRAVLEILRETKPNLPAYFRQ
jgi:hypothetical protein